MDGTVSSSAPRVPTAPSNLTVGLVTETTIAMSWDASRYNRSFSYQVRMTNHTKLSVQHSHYRRFLPDVVYSEVPAAK
jgi:hypothetical protein